ncbi:translation initiation factor IF-2 [Collibacillus ludicampi]|uniref:Translation initiation factor IF-2 n=1 Tax=Collibacillus ludicampi TaxID=2771369 RepID=A0AAV4LJ21_9BACL|nr:translation initiation factor IF-2 [Collibacillus ludicampi]GIM47842.1 translation initiation factor IF-2 [Collibacillus ludicampi]
MSKLRVYEYAKQKEMTSKEVIAILNRMNISVNNHMSVMNREMIEAVENYLTDKDHTSMENSQVRKKQVDEQNQQKRKVAAAKAEDKPAVKRTAESNQERKGGNEKERNHAGNRDNRLTFERKISSIELYENLDEKAPIIRHERIQKRPKQGPNGTKELRKLNTPPAGARNGSQGGRGAKGKGGSQGNQQRGKGQGRPNYQQPAQAAQTPKQPDYPKKIKVEGPMTVAEFAKQIKREPSEVIKKLLYLGIMATINQEIDLDAIQLVAADFDVEVEVVEPVDEEAIDMLIEEENPEDLQERPPIVTIMGHVDHGKTTLLDAIRHTKVTETEAGGITQHIGAYQVEINGKKITFLDTPGHAAFTSMRARGAQVTDVTILVVAADDGVMPQTVEAINHAKAANVPIIVAINKIDKPDANPDRVKQELTEYGLIPEEWGGDTIFQPVSALKKTGIDDLLEMILLVAEVAELKANPDGRPRGTVIEAELDKGRGPVATVLVQNGTLRVGDIVVAGTSYGRVRAMINDRGRRVKEAPPSCPVEILGLNEVPSAGDLFVVYDDERKARQLVEKRQAKQKQELLGAQNRVTLEDLYKQIQEGEVKELNIIIKADVQGSVEALAGALEKIDISGVRVNIIHKAVGAITESDILLATASNAIVIGFNVRPETNASKMAESENVDIRLYRVIYDAIDEIESALKGMLDPEYKEVIVGRAEVRQIFKVSKIGTIAGCYVTDGKIARNNDARVIRDGIVVYEGKFDSLKRYKDDVREVAAGFECGLTLERFNDIKEGDIIEAFVMEPVKI